MHPDDLDGLLEDVRKAGTSAGAKKGWEHRRGQASAPGSAENNAFLAHRQAQTRSHIERKQKRWDRATAPLKGGYTRWDAAAQRAEATRTRPKKVFNLGGRSFE